MIDRAIAIIEAPSTLGLASDGVERLPDELLDGRLAERIGARRAERLAVPEKHAEPDPATGVLNAVAIADWSPVLADAVAAVLDADEFPLILGGDCTILLGSMLALRRRGRYGLLFVDGNADFFQPEAEPNGEGASMDLAWATGHGPALLTDLEGLAPLVRAEDTVAFGYRDHEDQAAYGSQQPPDGMMVLDLPSVRRRGISASAAAVVEHLIRPGLDGFFVHLDADVLDDAVMPAVDFRVPGGLSWDELAHVLRTAIASGRVVGMEVTIYNPKLDPSGEAGSGLTDVLVQALGD